MSGTFYDPNKAPDPPEWQALSDVERIRLTRNFHQAARIKSKSLKLHAAIHVAVEDQIAMGYGPTCRTMARLQAEGLNRHEANHAIGSVLSQFSAELSNPKSESQSNFNLRMNAAIESLTAAKWKSRSNSEDE